MDKAKRHLEICQELYNIYVIKNHDYGDSFGRTFKDLGIISAITRMYDKLNRLISLTKTPQQVDESLRDTLLDLSNYAIMSIMELEDQSSKSETSSDTSASSAASSWPRPSSTK